MATRNPTAPTEKPGRRRLSRRLFRYVRNDFLVILGVTLLAFLTLFLVAAIYDDLQDFISKGVPMPAIVRYFLLLQPEALVLVLPMSLLLAAMYTVASLGKNHELTAMRASGVSLWHAFLPIFLIAVLAGIVQSVLAESVAPRARQQATRMHERLTSSPADWAESQREQAYLAYHDRDQRRDWLFRDFAASGVSHDVVVTQFGEDGGREWELQAAEAEFRLGRGWLFTKGTWTDFSPASGALPGAPQAFETRTLEDAAANPRSMSFLFRLKPAEQMSAHEALSLLRERGDELSRSTVAVMWTHFWSRLALPWSCLVAALLGVPMAVSRERSAATRSIVLGVGLMAIFFVVVQVFVVLGKMQWLPPVVAGGLPTLIFLLWGSWELKRKM